jgi:hypothetical protein
MVIAAVLSIVALAYLGIEIVLSLLLQPALLVSPVSAGDWLTGIPEQQPVWAIIAAASALAVIGIVFCVIALTPGRLPKHQMVTEGSAVLVDNAVIAAALAQYISDHTGIVRDRISVGVSHRVVDVTVSPDAGLPVVDTQIRELVASELEHYQLTRGVKTRVRTPQQHKGSYS